MKGASQRGLVVKNPSVNAADASLIPEVERSLKKEMATHCSILPWEIPWTEGPGMLESTGLQVVRYN